MAPDSGRSRRGWVRRLVGLPVTFAVAILIHRFQGEVNEWLDRQGYPKPIAATIGWLVAYPYLILLVPLGVIAYSLWRSSSGGHGAGLTLSEKDTAPLDELARLAADAETAVLRTKWYTDDVQGGVNAIHAFGDAVKARQSQLADATNTTLARYTEAVDQAVYFLSQMPPGALATADDELNKAMASACRGLVQRVKDERQRLVRHFQELRGLAEPQRRRWWHRPPRLQTMIATNMEGTEAVVNVQNRGGTAMIRTRAGATLYMGIPYPLQWKTNDTPARRIVEGGGGELVIARTEEWSGFIPGTNTVDTGQRLTLPGADGTDAMRRKLWHLKYEEENYYGPALNPEIRITVTFETEPPLAEVLRESYIVKGEVTEGRPYLTIQKIP